MSLTEAQLKERATYIGSSDAKTIASGDIAQWTTLARQKSGEEVWKPNKQTQLLMDTGSYLEPYIIDKWAEQTVAKLTSVEAAKLFLLTMCLSILPLMGVLLVIMLLWKSKRTSALKT